MSELRKNEGPKPIQFSILSVIIVTVAVAVFFALATQAPPIFASAYLFILLIVMGILLRKFLEKPSISCTIIIIFVAGLALPARHSSGGPIPVEPVFQIIESGLFFFDVPAKAFGFPEIIRLPLKIITTCFWGFSLGFVLSKIIEKVSSE